jgi:hypothetical protein
MLVASGIVGTTSLGKIAAAINTPTSQPEGSSLKAHKKKRLKLNKMEK